MRNKSSDPIFVGQDRIEEVQEFCYLGSMVSSDGECELDVETRIRKARGRFALMRNIWSDTRLSRNTKLRLFKSNVVSVLLYGCETWKVSSSISSKLQVFINGCLRLILRIRRLEGVMNVELWRLANMEPISTTIKMRKWRWLGHTQRKQPGDITRSALTWSPQGARRRGRPRNTWRRTLHDELRAKRHTWRDFETTAPDRAGYRQFVKALCS